MRLKSKFGKLTTKATAIALAFVMTIPTAAFANVDFGEYSEYPYTGMPEDDITVDNLQSVLDEAIERGVPNAFIRHNLSENLDILADSKIDLNDGEKLPSIKISDVENSAGMHGLEIKKIDTGLLARTKLYLGEYDFGKLEASRLVYNMLAKKNLKAKAYLYLDDSEDAFAEIKIKRSGDSDWEKTKAYTVDVRGENLSGSHKVYLKVVANEAVDNEGKIIAKTGVNTNLFLESLFFIEGSTPVLDFDLDSDFASMDAVNASENHTVESTGDMITEIPGVDNDQKYELDYIRGRGNSTWQASKKPYKVKLNKKADLFGMGANKHWILLANYYDYTLLRNRFTFEIAKELGLNYTPESVCVNLVINGEYYGSYQLCEQIRVGKSRVDIDDLEELEEGEDPADPEIVTGGYLINMGGSWLTSDGSEERITTTPYDFVIESPEYDADYSEKGKEAQLKYINNYFAIINKLISDLEPIESEEEEFEPTAFTTKDALDDAEEVDEEELDIPDGATWRDYMDEQSLIDYYLIQEFSLNGDAYYGGSTYLYKPRNGKLFWGPVWDFDFVAWNATETEADNFDGYGLTNRAPWVSKLLSSDEQFAKNVENRWKVLKPILEEMISEGGKLDQFAEETYMSALANYQVKRSILMGDDEDSAYAESGERVNFDPEGNVYTLNYFNEINRLKDFVAKRIVFCDETIDDVLGNAGSFGEGANARFFLNEEDCFTDVEPYAEIPVVMEVRENGIYGYINEEDMPEAPERDGYEFKGWYYRDETGNYVKYVPGDNIFLTEEWEGQLFYYIPSIFAQYKEIGAKEVEKVEFLADTFYHYVEKRYDSYYEEDYYAYNEINLLDLIKYEPIDALLEDISFKVEKDENADESVYANIYGYYLEVGGPQELTIIVKYGDKEISAKLVVTDDKSKFVDEEKYSVDKEINLKVGETKKIEVKYEDGKYRDYTNLDSYSYASSDESVASVSRDGVITAKADGEASIVVVNHATYNNKAKIIKVTVGNKKTEEAKKDEKKSEATKAPAVGTTLKDKTFKLKVTKAASDDKKVAGEVKITGLLKKNTKKAVIKSTVTIDGYKYNVTEIGAKAFAKAKKLTKVTIKGNKLPKIGKKAFFKKGKKVTIKVNKKLVKKAKKALKKAKCKGYKVK